MFKIYLTEFLSIMRLKTKYLIAIQSLSHNIGTQVSVPIFGILQTLLKTWWSAFLILGTLLEKSSQLTNKRYWCQNNLVFQKNIHSDLNKSTYKDNHSFHTIEDTKAVDWKEFWGDSRKHQESSLHTYTTIALAESI